MTRLTARRARGNATVAQAVSEGLPPRVAQVVHALLETLTQAGGGPVTAAEVMIYDEQALTVQAAAAALLMGLGLGLADRVGTGLWTATERAWERRGPGPGCSGSLAAPAMSSVTSPSGKAAD